MPTPLFLRAPVLRPGSASDSAEFLPDAAVITDSTGTLTFLGAFSDRPPELDERAFTRTNLLIPPLLDCHIHIPQNPIRGRFVEGVTGDEPEGPLLAGLARNVFPAEARCADPIYAKAVVQQFLADTRAAGTLGGVAYMTSSPAATRIALEILPKSWRVGLVLMDQLCPDNLKIDLDTATRAMRDLAQDFGQRLIITDRFAVACSSPLRKAAVQIAHEFGLGTQTHLSEQPGELATIKRLYPRAKDYTDVYDQDGLLTVPGHALLAHCIHLSDREWARLAETQSLIAHCPVSNTLLGSGTMPLDKVYEYNLDYALCTDVGASPTPSLFHEMGHFLGVHAGRSKHATATTAFYRTTAAARRVGQINIGDLQLGSKFAAVSVPGLPAVDSSNHSALLPASAARSADDIIRTCLLPSGKVAEDQVLESWNFD